MQQNVPTSLPGRGGGNDGGCSSEVTPEICRPGEEGTPAIASTNRVLSDHENGLKFLQSIYLDATNTIRHYDTQRAGLGALLGTVLTIISSGLVALSRPDAINNLLPIGAGFLALVSVAFLIAVIKINYLIILQRARAREAVKLYQAATGDAIFLELPNSARKATRSLAARVSLGHVWVSLFALIAIFNFLLLILYSLKYLN